MGVAPIMFDEDWAVSAAGVGLFDRADEGLWWWVVEEG